MDTKKMVPMIIGLTVAIILVTSLMVPVITSLGSGGVDEGDIHITESNTGDYYIRATDGTQIELYTTGQNGELSYEDITENPDAETWGLNDVYMCVIGTYFYLESSNSGFTMYMYGNTDESLGEGSMLIDSPITISGNTLTVTDSSDDSEYTFEGVQFYTAPETMGTYVAITNDDGGPATNPYVGNAYIGVAIDGWDAEDELVIIGFGNADSDFTYANYLNWSGPSEVRTDGKFVIEDGLLTEVIVTYDGEPYTYSVTGPEDDYEVYYYVPIEVREGGSGGTAISGTLMAMLSVIPLVTIVGIIMGAIGFLRMRGD